MKITLNTNIGGYETLKIEELPLDKVDMRDDTCIVTLDASTSDKLIIYYNAVRELLIKGCKIIVFIIKDESKIAKSICNLMASYKNYHIYQVSGKEKITPDYVNAVIEREPTIEEVHNFVGCDVAAYSELNALLLGIENVAKEGDIEHLKEFVNEYGDSIFALNEVLSYMRYITESTNSGERDARINELKLKMEELKQSLDAMKQRCKQQDEELLKKDDNIGILNREVAKLRDLAEANKQAGGGGRIINSYSEYNTSMHDNHVQHILYFKELSQIPYINSMMMQLCARVELVGKETNKDKIKLLIYDDRNRFKGMYNGLTNIGGQDIERQISNGLLKARGAVVVSEPNQSIIANVLGLNNPPYDIVIIYDRLGELGKDIVVGNNVTKFWVMNSLKEAQSIKSLPGGSAKDGIITRQEENVSGEHLCIPYIEDYKASSQSSKMSKYFKAVFKNNQGKDTNILMAIMMKARINFR